MTERLTRLLHAEADGLDVPIPAADDVLTRGRGLRRRRRTTQLVAGAAVLAVLGGGAGLAASLAGGSTGGPHRQATDRGAAGSTPDMGAVFTIGNVLYYDDGTKHVQLRDTAVKSMYPTSAGVLVRTGDNTDSDGGGPQRFELVTPAGAVSKVSVVTEDDIPGVDATEPYLAYSEKVDGGYDVVVHDVATDTEVARIHLPGLEFQGGWSAPPVALSGDLVYVDSTGAETVVDWRTGTVGTTTAIAPGYPIVLGGHAPAGDAGRRHAGVVDVATGATLLSVPTTSEAFFILSPDGRFAVLDSTGIVGVSRTGQVHRSGPPPTTYDVYDVATGDHVSLAGHAFAAGWSTDGRLFTVRGSTLTSCSAETGDCSTTTFDGSTSDGDTRLVGQTYES